VVALLASFEMPIDGGGAVRVMATPDDPNESVVGTNLRDWLLAGAAVPPVGAAITRAMRASEVTPARTRGSANEMS
jgi:hypothetical protein